MEILLIYPASQNYKHSFMARSMGQKFIVKPLNLSILCALTPKEHEVKIIDEKFQKINFDEKFDLVAITVSTFDAYRSYEIADEFRKKGIPVVLGGWHPTVLPEEARWHADAVVIGEAEEIWPKLLRDVEFSMLKSFYNNLKPVSANLVPPIDHKGKQDNSFIGRIQATRGCNCNCEYCIVSNIKQRGIFRKRPVSEVVRELKQTPQRLLYFYDESLTLDVNYTKNLFKEIKGLKKKFVCNGSADVLSKDDELLRLSKEAGCIEWAIGFESVSQETIDAIGKTTNKVEDYLCAVKKIKDYEMNTYGNFIFGFDTDTPNVFDRTINTISNWELDAADFHILLPFPGTRLFNRLDKGGRILTKNWSKYVLGNVVFKPMHMSPEELKDGVEKMYKEFYLTPKIFKRLCENIKHGFCPFIITLMTNFPHMGL